MAGVGAGDVHPCWKSFIYLLGPNKPSRPWSKEVVCDNEGNITVATDERKFLTKMQKRQKFKHYVFVQG